MYIGRLPPGVKPPDLNVWHAAVGLPVLQHLQTWKITNGIYWVRWTPMHNTPMLIHLELSDTLLYSLPPLCWRNLRSISLIRCPCSTYDLPKAIGSAADCLDSLTIHHHDLMRPGLCAPANVILRSHSTRKLPNIDLIALTSLDLDFRDSDYKAMHSVIEHIRTPRLARLALSSISDHHLPSIRALARSSNFGGHLQTLIIHTRCFSSCEGLFELLAGLNALQTLTASYDVKFRIEGRIVRLHTDALLHALQ
ncbi:hypothetical protein BDV98DRAFT_597498 [Pterulicium gracile]|uniref:F-box domain-containing protein n=1 Tax=Pterulicium gracile TaxID=1884261 RepID=A0A5C3Q3C6_9AGAR|nr:hypothetical protein BDV98DRAFT_597498 [Pterula gracilis]